MSAGLLTTGAGKVAKSVRGSRLSSAARRSCDFRVNLRRAPDSFRLRTTSTPTSDRCQRMVTSPLYQSTPEKKSPGENRDPVNLSKYDIVHECYQSLMSPVNEILPSF
jgi:hypothetical protein